MIYVAFVIGMVLTGGMVFLLMPRLMFVTKKSRYGFSDTVERLEKSIKANNWGHRGTWFVDQELKEKGLALKARIANVTLCKAPYAAEILNVEQNRFVATLMPCAFSVWEDDQKNVYVSKMNTGLMGPIFGGVIAKIMGRAVSREESRILNGIVHA